MDPKGSAIGLRLGVEPEERLIQREIVSSTGDVLADLLLQSLGRWPGNFRAQTVEKEKADLCGLVERDGMKVEDVSFHRKRVVAEGRSIADVGD